METLKKHFAHALLLLSVLSAVAVMTGCENPEERYFLKQKSFPWQLMPDYMPYSEGDTLRYCSTDLQDTILCVLEHENKEYEEFTRSKRHTVPSNYNIGGDIATREYKFNILRGAVQDNFSFNWNCSRYLFRFVSMLEYNGKQVAREWGASDFPEEYQKMQEQKEYDILLNSLPDTLNLENNDLAATIINGRGVVMITDKSKNQIWKFIEENNTTSNNTDTTTTPVMTNDDEKAEEAEGDTKIDNTECYLLQECNELGEPVESYECIVFERKGGHTFEEAFASIKTDLDLLVARMVSDEEGGGNYDAEKWEIRQVVRQIKNAPNDRLIYTAIELYMFSLVYNAYTVVYQFWVIDSEGNIYQIVGPSEE